MLRLDHVFYAVPDLDEAAVRFREAFGLDSAVGGRHLGFGTANRIVPLGDQYLEVIGVVDRDEAEANPFGRTVLEQADAGGGWLVMVASCDHVDAVADRLELELIEGARQRPDGQQVRWRMAGLDDPGREPWMPFFITGTSRRSCTPAGRERLTACEPMASRGPRSAATPNGSARGSATRSCRSGSPMIDPGSAASRSRHQTESS